MKVIKNAVIDFGSYELSLARLFFTNNPTEGYYMKQNCADELSIGWIGTLIGL